MKVVFVSYNNQLGYYSPQAWLEKINTSVMLMEALSAYCKVACIKLINYEGPFSQNGVDYLFLRSGQKRSLFPRLINSWIKKMHPDIVIISGISSSLQIIQLKWQLGKGSRLIGRHHADKAPSGLRRTLQQYADKCLDAYLFTSYGNAMEWMEAGIISDKVKIKELIEASTEFSKLDKETSLQSTGMGNGPNFIWVGRLNANKDPDTVLDGFEKYLGKQPDAKLYMIFHEKDMLPDVQQKIQRLACGTNPKCMTRSSLYGSLRVAAFTGSTSPIRSATDTSGVANFST